MDKLEVAKLYREGKITLKTALENGMQASEAGVVMNTKFDYDKGLVEARTDGRLGKTIETVPFTTPNEKSVIHARRTANSSIKYIYGQGKIPLQALANTVNRYKLTASDHRAYLSNLPDSDLGEAILILAGCGVDITKLNVTKCKAQATTTTAKPKGDTTRVVPVSSGKPMTEGYIAYQDGLQSIAARESKFKAGMSKKDATEIDFSDMTDEQKEIVCKAMGIPMVATKKVITIK